MAELREITSEQLKKILEEHRKWVGTKGKLGKRADLGFANLQKADLRGANLQKANLLGADLQEADLGVANLQKANLINAKLQEAYLRGAKLQEAYLRGANLQGAYLFSADLQKAYLGNANLQGANLVGAVGLTVSQVKFAKSWDLAYYSDDFLKKLGLQPGHNESVKKKLAELAKKAAGTKK